MSSYIDVAIELRTILPSPRRIRANIRKLQELSLFYVILTYATLPYWHRILVIKLATEIYVQAGFNSVFCGCILPMLRSSYKDPFCPNILQTRQFLIHFYGVVTKLVGQTSSQRWRLYYTITLMRLIKNFDKTIISSNAKPLHWRAVVELRGPWLGILWRIKGESVDQERYSCNLLVILAEMLIADITEKSFKHVWECPNEMYVLGNDTSKSKRVPKTILTFTVYGSKKICNLFRSYLEDEDSEEFQPPEKWPNNQFTLNLDIFCKEAMKWGCSKSQHMEFGPFTAVPSSTEDLSENYFKISK